MASSLSSTAYYSRKAIKYFAIGVVVYLILYIAYNIAQPLLQREPPPPPIVPQFGGLPAPEFPQVNQSLNFTYRLETITGGLPVNFPDRTVVFSNQLPPSGFFSLTNVIKSAASYGFREEPIPIAPPMYQWKKVDALPGLLEIHTLTKETDLIFNWRFDQDLLISNKRLTEPQAFGFAVGALKKGGLWNKDLEGGDHKLLFYRVFKDQLLKVSSVSEADMVQVNFRRSKISDLTSVFPDPERPPVWVMVSRTGNLLELHYHYFPNSEKTSEYPLRPVLNAWQDLVSGKAYIARMGDNIPGDEVVIRQVELSYYITSDFQPFTQTVYVFKGDKDFVAYVPAVERGQTSK